MAYQGGGLLQFLNPDLSTRPGAQSAMDSAKFCFLIVAGFRIVIYAFIGFASATTLGAASVEPWLVIGLTLLIDIGLPLLAAWRLHVYQGAIVVPVATAFYVLGILLSFNIAGLVIGLLFTAVFVGGMRGAWALRRGTGFEDDYYATFS